MASQPHGQLHFFFIPFLARGHTLPLLETARLFADRDVLCSIIITAGNASYIRPIVEDHPNINLLLIPFPSAAVGLPSGIECTDVLPSGHDNLTKFFDAVDLLRHDFKNLAVEHNPDCIVADTNVFSPAQVAADLSIPCIQFCVFSPFSQCVIKSVHDTCTHPSWVPAKTIGPLAGLPHRLELGLREFPTVPAKINFMENYIANHAKSCGILYNSFDDLAPEYVEHYGRAMDIKVFCVGPVQLRKSVADWDDGNSVKKWLDSKSTDSVIYISFGSECKFNNEQLREIALGLASCDHSFIWVVRLGGLSSGNIDDWLPEEFRAAVQSGKGLMITEWAPQVAILNHRATGGFLLHCGWNSVVETLCAGLPAIAWPLHSEQFINERFVVEVLKIGVRILEGAEMRTADEEYKKVVMAAAIKAAVNRLMGGGDDDEEVKAMRAAVKEYAVKARMATEEGGSSTANLSAVVEMIRAGKN